MKINLNFEKKSMNTNPMEIKTSIYQSALSKSFSPENNWEALNYTSLNISKVRNFLRYAAIYGVSFDCLQEFVTNLETMVANNTFTTWKEKNPELVKRGLSRAFAYLFSHLNIEAGNVDDDDIQKCLMQAQLKITTPAEFMGEEM